MTSRDLSELSTEELMALVLGFDPGACLKKN
jgi:hypothetical protein